MTVIFQSHHKFEFCDKILRSFAEDDGDSLLVATSSQEVSLASLKMMQIFSPLLMEIVETLPLTSTPHTLIIPDADAESWKYLTGLLTNGNVDINLPSDNSNIKCQKDKISSLAQCLRIKLETKQVSEEARIKLRVKRPEELMDGSIHHPFSNQDTNIMNNDYDSDKAKDEVPIKSENMYSNNCASSEHNFPIKREINEAENFFVSGGERCNDSGIDVESSLRIQEVTYSQVEIKGKKSDNYKLYLVDNIVGNENFVETFSGHLSEGELVSSDDDQSQSCSYDSTSIFENVSVKAAHREDESLPAKDPSVGQDDNTKICTGNLQDKVSVEVKRLELELENFNSQKKVKKKRRTRRSKKQKCAEDNTEATEAVAVADFHFKTKAEGRQDTIYVGKLPAGEAMNKKNLEAHFAQFGEVVKVVRPVDKMKNNKPSSFAFITFARKHVAKTLVKQGSTVIGEHSIEIKKVTPMDQTGGMGGGRGAGGGGYGGGWGYADPYAGYGGYGGYGDPYGGYGYGGGRGGANYGGGPTAGGARGKMRGGGARGGMRGRGRPY